VGDTLYNYSITSTTITTTITRTFIVFFNQSVVHSRLDQFSKHLPKNLQSCWCRIFAAGCPSSHPTNIVKAL